MYVFTTAPLSDLSSSMAFHYYWGSGAEELKIQRSYINGAALPLLLLERDRRSRFAPQRATELESVPLGTDPSTPAYLC